jgi:nucleotide-binding universal stress UspA family protein
MFSRFMIATDLSHASFALVRSLKGLQAFGAKQCLLLTCLSMGETTAMAFSLSMGAVESNLEKQKRILEEQGFVTTTELVLGFAKSEINRIAREHKYPLIVVGSRGRTLVGTDLLGGVASAVIHHATAPVLVVPVAMKEGQGEVRIQAGKGDFCEHVLFPTDFSENALQTFIFLKEMVGDRAKKVTLFHVQDKTRIEPHLADRLEEFNKKDLARLEDLKQILKAGGRGKIEIDLAYGYPYEEIMRVIRERDVRLVVMGSQGRGFIKELFLGSVSHNVVRNSDAPVLLIPAKR